jgi:hypothetical protein
VLEEKIKPWLSSLFLILFFGGLAFGYDFYGTSFQYRKDITIDNTKIDANLSYFPVLVKLTSSNIDFGHFLHSTNDGYDIRFTDSIDGSGDANGNILDYERERFDKSGEVAEIWVEIPSISSSSPTTFYMFYGNTDCADGEDENGTWDVGGSPTDYYREVFHLHEISGTHYDSTSSGYTGATVGTVYQDRTGEIDGVDEFVGPSESRLSLSDGTLTANSPFTIEVWFYIETHQNVWIGLVDKGRDVEPDWVGLGIAWQDPNNNICSYWDYRNGSNMYGSALSTGRWYYAATTYDGTDRYLYLDDSQEAGPRSGDTYPGNIPENTRVGDDSNGNYLDGFIDEVRFSDVARSAAWLKASYHSGNDTLLTIPTLVELSYFRATSLDSAVLLEWATETELDNAGFNVWRSEEKDEGYARINPYFIPAEGEAGFGVEYNYTDYDVRNGTTYYYKLEDIDIYGKSTFHGPVPATLNDIIIIWPDEGKILPTEALLFSWASFDNYSFKVEISSNPSFSAAETLSFPGEGWIYGNSLWLSPREWELVLKKAYESGGQLFWRVRASSEDGKKVFSNWKRFLVEDPKVTEK